jgi:type II secretory pathway pseudopilin PulG
LLVVIAIVSLLASLLLPALSRAKEKGRRVACMSNMRQIGVGSSLYESDHQLQPPDVGDVWDFCVSSAPSFLKSIIPYTGTKVLVCPSVTKASPIPTDIPTPRSETSYLGNAVVMGRRSSIIPKPAQLITLQECIIKINVCALRPFLSTPMPDSSANRYTWWHDNLTLSYELYSVTHSSGGNVYSADGHIEYRKSSSLLSGEFGLIPDADHQTAYSLGNYGGAF